MKDEAPSHPFPAKQVLVTLAASAAYLALDEVPLPSPPGYASRYALTLGSVGLSPVFVAFVLVELGAALWPGLHQARAGADLRTRMRTIAYGLALGLASLQAYGVVWFAAASGSVFERGLLDPRVLLAAPLVGGVLLAVMLAKLIDVAGIGSGYPVLIGASIASSLARWFYRMGQTFDDEAMRFLLVLALFAVAAWRMLAAPPYAGSRGRYRIPTSGVEPVHYAVLMVSAWGLDAARVFSGPQTPAWEGTPWFWAGVQVMMTLALCWVFSRLFHHAVSDEDRAALARATRTSTFWLVGMTAAAWFVQGVSPPVFPRFDVFSVVPLLAVGMDLAAELRAGQRRGPQRILRSIQRVEEADALSAALAAAGIETALRGARLRSLYRFFAPYIPVGVLVAEGDLERAQAVAGEHERAMAEPPPVLAVQLE